LPDGPRSVGGPKEDTRSVDDLLSFIEGSDSTDSAASGGKKASSKSAKKKRDRQKKKERERAAHGVNMQAEQEAPQAETTKHVEAALGGSKPTARGAANAGSARREVAPTSADLRSMLDSFEFGDSDEDDDLDLDPEQRAKQDRCLAIFNIAPGHIFYDRPVNNPTPACSIGRWKSSGAG
jgi:hypothetical protein